MDIIKRGIVEMLSEIGKTVNSTEEGKAIYDFLISLGFVDSEESVTDFEKDSIIELLHEYSYRVNERSEENSLYEEFFSKKLKDFWKHTSCQVILEGLKETNFYVPLGKELVLKKKEEEMANQIQAA